MPDTCETVRIKGGEFGFIEINKSDFNEKEHALYSEGEKKAEKPKKAAKKAK